MSPIQLIFLIVSAVGLLSALGTVLARNLVHAALFLVAFFFTITCQFVLLEAEFLAAMQVLIYIGAVSILLLFGIMLTRNIQGDETTGGHWGWKLPAGIVALGVLGVLLFGINAEQGRPGQEPWVRINARPGGVNPRVGGPESIALAYSPSGQFIASADADGRVRLWTLAGRQMAVLHLGGLAPTAVTFSPESGLVAAANDQGAVRVWHPLSRRAVLDRSGGRPGAITSMALGPLQFEDDQDNRLVAVGGADGVVRVWVGPDPVEIEAHEGVVEAMTFTSDGRLITAGADGQVVTWDLGTAESVPAASSPAGRSIADVALGLVPPPQEEVIDPQGPPPPPPPPPAAGGVSGPLLAVASTVDGEPGRWNLRVLNVPDQQEVAAFEGLRGVPVAVSLASDARRVAALVLPDGRAEGEEVGASADARAVVRFWNLDPEADSVGPFEVEVPGPVGSSSRLAAGPQGLRFAVASEAAPMSFYDDRVESWAVASSPAATASTVIADMPRAVGIELMTRSVIPFEVAGLMLTAALVGAIVLARQEPRTVPTPPEAEADRLVSDRPIPPGDARTLTPGPGTATTPRVANAIDEAAGSEPPAARTPS